jgi:hypothetical protein
MYACYLISAIVVTSFVLGVHASVEYLYLRATLELDEMISWCRLQLGSFP